MIRRDPGRGAQPERTRLAWRRTVLTVAIVELLTLRLALLAEPAWVRVPGIAVGMLLLLAALVAGHRRIRGLARDEPFEAPSAVMLAVITAGFATLGLALFVG